MHRLTLLVDDGRTDERTDGRITRSRVPAFQRSRVPDLLTSPSTSLLLMSKGHLYMLSEYHPRSCVVPCVEVSVISACCGTRAITVKGSTRHRSLVREEENRHLPLRLHHSDWDVSQQCGGYVADISGGAAIRVSVESMEHESKVQCTREMFRYAESFNQPLARGICVAVKICLGMVLYMSDFHQPLSCRNVSNVVDMGDMFYTASGLLEPACLDQWDARRPMETWSTANVTTMSMMFDGAIEFIQPLGRWNDSRAESTNFMFRYTATFNQPLPEWDIRDVTDMRGMFERATAYDHPLDAWQHLLDDS
eukprot:gene15674-17582_t